MEKGAKPIGLAARDTLRLEAGLNLYGVDMSLDNHPYESNLAWTIDMNDESREFIGKNALLELKESQTKLIGFYTNERGVLRAGTEIAFKGGTGKITSGTWSPTFKKKYRVL
jgi:aminomethyltransferase